MEGGTPVPRDVMASVPSEHRAPLAPGGDAGATHCPAPVVPMAVLCVTFPQCALL